ncbi:MAG TPA: hypothetical protein VFQ39_19705 [Longimicrobium sp.]|nr:hypothetical protein [Longimicrobium sp.]
MQFRLLQEEHDEQQERDDREHGEYPAAPIGGYVHSRDLANCKVLHVLETIGCVDESGHVFGPQLEIMNDRTGEFDEFVSILQIKRPDRKGPGTVSSPGGAFRSDLDYLS